MGWFCDVIKEEKYRRCPECDGDGKVEKDCDYCREYPGHRWYDPIGGEAKWVRCDYCYGEGKETKRCNRCDGDGEIRD